VPIINSSLIFFNHLIIRTFSKVLIIRFCTEYQMFASIKYELLKSLTKYCIIISNKIDELEQIIQILTQPKLWILLLVRQYRKSQNFNQTK
jgi:hypothetical protein